MIAKGLNIIGLRDHAAATVTYYATKVAAAAALKGRNLGPEVRPERAANRFFRFWIIAAAPVGDPGEGRVLLTAEGGWMIMCTTDCHDSYWSDASRHCPGHPMSKAESKEFTLALLGHRTEVISIGLHRQIEGIDWVTLRPYVDHISAGFNYWARCLGCGWRSIRFDERRHAGQGARRHEQSHFPSF